MSNKFELSNRIFAVVVVFLVGLIGFWSFRAYEIWYTASGNYAREISVEATGIAYYVPDVAKITLGVETRSYDSADAVTVNTKKINEVMAAIKGVGIEEKDIRTTYYNLDTNYKYTEQEGSIPDGFILNQSLEVTVRDFAKIGDLLAKTTAVGANMVGGLNFTMDDTDAPKAKAREEAIKKAKAKAEEIEKQSGIKLGKVVNFYEYEGYDYGKGGGAYMAKEISAAPIEIPEIEPGQEQVSLSVTLTYKVE